MTGPSAAVALVGYAVLLCALAPALRRARWVVRAPGLAIRLWQALSLSWLLSLTIAGLALATPWLVDLVWASSPGADPSAAETAYAAAGAVLAAAVLARAGYVQARELTRARRTRRRHADDLSRIGRTLPGLDATVVDHATPEVYCLAGTRRRRRIVVTTGALALLDDSQLGAVLEHERAHLRARHHVVTATAGALDLAFPGVPLLRDARREIAMLAEMAADDAACRKHGAGVVAGALVGLAVARTRDPALGAGGHTVIDRAERMVAPAPRLRLPARVAAAATSAVALVLPVVCACTTVMVVAAMLIASLPS
jgi:hypothetical protein